MFLAVNWLEGLRLLVLGACLARVGGVGGVVIIFEKNQKSMLTTSPYLYSTHHGYTIYICVSKYTYIKRVPTLLAQGPPKPLQEKGFGGSLLCSPTPHWDI